MHEHHSGPKSNGKMAFMNAMTPMQTFVFGAVAGFMTLCTIGFFILLGVVLNGGALAVAQADTAPTVAAPTAPTPAAPAPTRDVKIDPPVDDKKDHIRGNNKAKVTIVEYSDFECPFCQRFHPTMKQVLADYGDDVRWVYRHFPLETIHPNARRMSVASECAAEQGKFWEYTDAVYENMVQAKTQEGLLQIAKDVGVGNSKFESCLTSNKYDSDVQSDIRAASAAGCTGTPCSIVVGPNGETTPINGAFPLERVKAVVDPLLK